MLKRGLALFLSIHAIVYLFLFAVITYKDIELQELFTNPKDLEAIAELVEWVEADESRSGVRTKPEIHLTADNAHGNASGTQPGNNVTERTSSVPAQVVMVESELPTNVLFLISDQHRADALGRYAALFGQSHFRAHTP